MLKIKNKKKIIIPILVIMLFVAMVTIGLAENYYSHATVISSSSTGIGSFFKNLDWGYANWNGYNSDQSDGYMEIGIKTQSGLKMCDDLLPPDNVRRYYTEYLWKDYLFAAYADPQGSGLFWGGCWVHGVQ